MRKQNTQQRINNYLTQNYTFIRDVVKDKVMYLDIQNKEQIGFYTINERLINLIVVDMATKGIARASDRTVIRSIKFLAIEQNPVKNYFQRFDTTSNKFPEPFIEFLSCVKIKGGQYNQTDFNEFLFDFMKGIYYKSVHGVDDTFKVLALCGPQGIGKSTFLNSLLPEKLKAYKGDSYLLPYQLDSMFTKNILIELDSNTHHFTDVWHHEVLRLLEIKNFEHRIPFTSYKVNSPVIASYCISFQPAVQNSFAPYKFPFFEVESIDLDTLETINMDKVWSYVISDCLPF